MVKEPWACLGVPSEFETFTGRARAVPRAWSLRHGAAQGGTVIFRYRLIIVRSICSPMIHSLIARSVHYPVLRSPFLCVYPFSFNRISVFSIHENFPSSFSL